MTNSDRFLWAISYAIGEKYYTCPWYFEDKNQAEARAFQIIRYNGHIRIIELLECKDGMEWCGKHLPYKEAQQTKNHDHG